MENVGTEQTGVSQKSLVSTLILSLISFFVSIGCCYFALFSVSFKYGLLSSADKIALFEETIINKLITQFVISNVYLFPGHEFSFEESRKWTLGLLYLFESQYRMNGVSSGYLSSNEYLHISPDSLISCIQSYHNMKIEELNANVGHKMGPYIFGSPGNVYYYFPNYTEGGKLLFPLSSKTFFDVQTNPLEFEIEKIQMFTGISTIKRNFVQNKRPFIVGLTIPNKRFEIQSKHGNFNCSFNNSLKCKYISLPPPSPYLVHPNPNGVYDKGESVVMDIVGFDDELVIPINDTYNIKGGFILRDEYHQYGHSMEYYTSKVSLAQENELCPDPYDVKKWIPTTLDCFLNESSQCNYTELECINEDFCNKSMFYAYVSDNKVIEWSNTTEPVEKEIEILSDYISLAFLPKNISNPNQGLCCYSVIPYSSVIEMIHQNKNGFLFEAFDITIEWETHSYPKKMKSCFNYTELVESIKKFTPLPTDPDIYEPYEL